MKVISTLLSKHRTVHCSDSYLTKHTGDAGVKLLEREKPKIVAVKKLEGQKK